MRKSFITLLQIIIITHFYSCNTNQNETELRSVSTKQETQMWEEIINSENSFDFVEFIVRFPETKILDSALNYYYKYIDYMSVPECFGDCRTFEIIYFTPDTIMVEGRPLNTNDLRNYCINFLLNSDGPPNFPEQTLITGLNGEELTISNGYFEVSYIKDSCPNLKEVIKEISASLYDYRDTLSIRWYNKKTADLKIEQKAFIENKLFFRIIFFEWESSPYYDF